jgi:predicted enzyme related to lactoylglutathione lyase
MAKHGHFHWNELMVHDAERAKAFYAKTLGWTFDAMPMPNGTYWVAKSGDDFICGIFPMNEPRFEGMAEQWTAYIAVDDIDTRLKQAVAAGAKICHGPFDIPGIGRVAFIAEPGGAMIGWITPV